MTKGVLINDLELGYAPLSAFTFMKMVQDKEWQHNVSDSHIYIIGQRKELTFNNFSFDTPKVVEFDIKQDGNDDVIHCILPVFQKHIATDLKKGVDIRLQSRKNTTSKKEEYPFNNTQIIIFQEFDEESKERTHLIWFSPEKLLQNFWKGYIDLDVEGNYRKFLNYKVHYVGKSTEQNICERLSNHSTFQAILANEGTLSYGNIPSNEITILLFRVEDNNTIVKWGDEATGEEMSNYIMNYQLPSDKEISLDAEKILIKKLQPEYNKVRFKSYPSSTDLIKTDFHDVIMYGISDPIKLIYSEGILNGSPLLEERDFITLDG